MSINGKREKPSTQLKLFNLPHKVYKMSQQADQGRSPVQTERRGGKQTVLRVPWVDRTLAIVSTRWFTFEDNKLRALQLESQIFSKCTRIRYLH